MVCLQHKLLTWEHVGLDGLREFFQGAESFVHG
jgi:hypothetical protein